VIARGFNATRPRKAAGGVVAACCLLAAAGAAAGDLAARPAFETLDRAMDGDADAVAALETCAATDAACALALAAALDRQGRADAARAALIDAYEGGQSIAAAALAERAFAGQRFIDAWAWSHAALAAGGVEAPAAGDFAGTRGPWLMHRSAEALEAAALDTARARARQRAAGFPGHVSGDDIPEAVERANPVYPMDLARDGIGGWAVAALSVAADGRVDQTLPLFASHEALGRATAEALSQWRYAKRRAGAWWTLQTIEYNLEPPADRSGDEDIGKMDAEGWIPFDGSGGLIEFVVEVNGQPARAMLDTGADGTFISRRLVERAGIGIDAVNTVRLAGIHGEREVPTTRGFELRFADISVPVHGVPISPASFFDLILGRGLFDLSVVQIDYPNQRIRFLDRQTAEFEGNLRTRRGRNNEIMLRAEIDGQPCWLLFDTGNAGTTLLKRSFVMRKDLEQYATGQTGAGMGAVSSGKQRLLQVPGFRLGPYPFASLLASYLPDADEGLLEGRQRETGSRLQRAQTRYDGILGHEVMQHFVVTTDLKKRRIHFALPPE